MQDAKCKICRRAGEKLFLKGERCFTPKCAVSRKPYPPGIHGRTARRSSSEFAAQLREKQKLRFLFQVGEQQLKNYVRAATQLKAGDAGEHVLEQLERRLDNVVFQAGFAQSRSVARQLVTHGHILVNSRRVGIPSYRVAVSDAVSLSPHALSMLTASDLDVRLKKYTPPSWLTLGPDQKIVTVLSLPSVKDSIYLAGTKFIIEYYSR